MCLLGGAVAVKAIRVARFAEFAADAPRLLHQALPRRALTNHLIPMVKCPKNYICWKYEQLYKNYLSNIFCLSHFSVDQESSQCDDSNVGPGPGSSGAAGLMPDLERETVKINCLPPARVVVPGGHRIVAVACGLHHTMLLSEHGWWYWFIVCIRLYEISGRRRALA